MLDSTHNAVAILVSLDTYQNKGISARSAQAEQYSAVGEMTGCRIRAKQETMYWDLFGTRYSPSSTTLYPTATNSSQESSQGLPKLVWVMPSCLNHSFILPSWRFHISNVSNIPHQVKIGDLGVTLWWISTPGTTPQSMVHR